MSVGTFVSSGACKVSIDARDKHPGSKLNLTKKTAELLSLLAPGQD
jgi:hypothetical protein